MIDEIAMALHLPLLGKLLLATFLSAVIGIEREVSGKAAGLRTNILICVGATLLADLSLYIASVHVGPGNVADPARLISYTISSMGWLGGAVVIQARGEVTGLTTAATLWVVAAIGLSVGVGYYPAAIGVTVFVLFVLFPLGYFERSRAIHSRKRGATPEKSSAALEPLG